jgi:hypothetical protein
MKVVGDWLLHYVEPRYERFHLIHRLTDWQCVVVFRDKSSCAILSSERDHIRSVMAAGLPRDKAGRVCRFHRVFPKIYRRVKGKLVRPVKIVPSRGGSKHLHPPKKGYRYPIDQVFQVRQMGGSIPAIMKQTGLPVSFVRAVKGGIEGYTEKRIELRMEWEGDERIIPDNEPYIRLRKRRKAC